MAYTLPRRYKWKGRRSVNSRWFYFENKESALDFAMRKDKKHLKRVHAGT